MKLGGTDAPNPKEDFSKNYPMQSSPVDIKGQSSTR